MHVYGGGYSNTDYLFEEVINNAHTDVYQNTRGLICHLELLH